jgi:hypothetical protein
MPIDSTGSTQQCITSNKEESSLRLTPGTKLCIMITFHLCILLDHLKGNWQQKSLDFLGSTPPARSRNHVPIGIYFRFWFRSCSWQRKVERWCRHALGHGFLLAPLCDKIGVFSDNLSPEQEA